MKKKFVMVVFIAAVIIAALWYTRPMTLAQLYPHFPLDDCLGVSISYIYYKEDGSIEECTSQPLLPGEENFDALIAQFESQTFRRSLRGLLPSSGWQSHPIQAGDFKWDVAFDFDRTTLPDGTIVARGMLLQASDFFGPLTFRSNAHSLRVTPAHSDQWRADVFTIMQSVS